MAFRVDGVSASYPQWQRSYATVDAAWASWVPVVSVVCDVCITRTDKLIQPLPSHAIDQGRRRQTRIPDLIITTPMGEVQLTDAMITRVNETAKQPLVNAKKAEQGKVIKYVY